MNFKEESDFTVNSSSLKEIRNFARELFEKVEELNDYKEAVSYTHLTLPTNREV